MTEKKEKMQVAFEKYIKQYVELLTVEKKEYFLSICDIDDELLDNLDTGKFSDFCAITLRENDYSEAVKARNNNKIHRIVLLSGEGIKQYDSLKDFNEYSAMCDNEAILWKCLEMGLDISIESKAAAFLGTVLEDGKITFGDFFNYLFNCISEREGLNAELANKNLPMLGIWGCRKKEFLPKMQIRRMIKKSRDSVIEQRLRRALLNNEIKEGKVRNTVVNYLAKDNIQGLLEKITYEEVENYLKGGTKDSAIYSLGEESFEEEWEYSNSYEYMICEHIKKEVGEIEKEWIDDKKDKKLLTWLDWEEYKVENIESENLQQIIELKQSIEELNMPKAKIKELQNKIDSFYTLFISAYQQTMMYTPICLQNFCMVTRRYTQAYFDILAYVMADDSVRRSLLNAEIVSKLQLLLCKREKQKIRMPYYHPVAILHYQALEKMYLYVIQEMKEESQIVATKRIILIALLKKLGMQFPVEFMKYNESLYAIDYATVWKKGHTEFMNTNEEVAYSALDFRIVEKQIVEYVEKHPIQTEIKIALMEISSLNGLPQVVDRIRQVSGSEKCNIGRVDFLILSSKEENLKKQLSQMWDTIGKDDIVRFRFVREDYREKGKYEVNKIIEDTDLTIIADCTALYYEPQPIKLSSGTNALRNRLVSINIEAQVADYVKYGWSDIETLWDTLQYVEKSREDGFWYWKSTEIDSRIITCINQSVARNEQKTVVVLSSNDTILSDIYASHYIQAHRQKYNGKNITIINFSKKNSQNKLPEKGDARISYSLNEFYDMFLDISNLSSVLQEDIHDIQMELYRESGRFYSKCILYTDDVEQRCKLEPQLEDKCKEWLSWQIETKMDNILGRYYSDLWINQWSEGVRSITAALMVRRLYEGAEIEDYYEKDRYTEKSSAQKTSLQPDDCMESVKIQEMLQFVYMKPAIDARTAQEFHDKYGKDMLKRIMESDSESKILEATFHKKLEELEQKVEEE